MDEQLPPLVAQGLTAKTIAERFSVSPQLICAKVREAGLALSGSQAGRLRHALKRLKASSDQSLSLSANDPGTYGGEGAPRIPEKDPLLAALKRAHA